MLATDSRGFSRIKTKTGKYQSSAFSGRSFILIFLVLSVGIRVIRGNEVEVTEI